MTHRVQYKQGGFTLLEMLLAITVAALLLAASSFLIVGLSNIWVRRTDMDSFEEHADGVANFIQQSLNQSLLRHQPTWVENGSKEADATPQEGSPEQTGQSSQEGTLSETLSENSSGKWIGGVDMERIDEGTLLEEPKLHFYFYHLPALLGADAPGAAAGVEAWLLFEKDRGLALVWKDTRSVQKTLISDEKELLRSSVLSTHVTNVSYLYLRKDERRWRSANEPEEYNNEYPTPTFLVLTFEEDGHTSQRTIVIPQTAPTMPLF